MIRDSFVFYRSYWSALKRLKVTERNALLLGIINYGLDGIEPDLSAPLMAMFDLVKPQIDANNTRYENGKKGAKHGAKGGRPSNKPQQNPTETPKKPLENPKETPTEPQTNPTETPNVNVNVNDNVNVNENDILSGKPDHTYISFSPSPSPASDLVAYLNAKTGRDYAVTGLNEAMVSRLLNSHSPDDVRSVIDKQVARWLDDPTMTAYLRPRTLFAPDKFDDYLNAPDVTAIEAAKETARSEQITERCVALRAELDTVTERLRGDPFNSDLRTRRAWLEDELTRLGRFVCREESAAAGDELKWPCVRS